MIVSLMKNFDVHTARTYLFRLEFRRKYV